MPNYVYFFIFCKTSIVLDDFLVLNFQRSTLYVRSKVMNKSLHKLFGMTFAHTFLKRDTMIPIARG